MTPMYFVACMDTTCPLNEDKQCRAPFIAIGENGECLIREGGPFSNKASTEHYVEIIECQCQKCNSWELDEVAMKGTCGLRENLNFVQRKHSDQALDKPKCNDFLRQIEPPGFTANL